ncbi:MAG: ATP-dependent sacrificial sulfur transferase LarE [Desulfobacterales bacterium]|nr:ATP-dependent sacrificial sulfur transferase LarE [Desulfobacterales bacterium]
MVAFSGGVDSTLLTYITHQELGDTMMALTIKTPYIPDWEVEEAELFAKEYNIRHEVIELPLPAILIQNPPERCYLCKTEVFKTILHQAAKYNISTVIEGSNKDDLSDYRPGMRALRELNIESPMLQLGITKDDIRKLSQQLGLKTWDKPSYACLLSRIPYHTEITSAELTRISQAEQVLRELNISGSRVRSHGNIARIELPLGQFPEILRSDQRVKLVEKIQACGYLYVTLDLEGYQTGSLNKTLKTEKDHKE